MCCLHCVSWCIRSAAPVRVACMSLLYEKGVYCKRVVRSTAMPLSLSCVYKTPIGPLELVAGPEGISAVRWLFGKHCQDQASVPDSPGPCMHEQDPSGLHVSAVSECEVTSLKDSKAEDSLEKKRAMEHMRVCINWLNAYFDGTLLQSDKPIPKPELSLPDGGEFFHRVWTTLASTGIGERLSYAEVARLAGSPRAARAVGQAVKKHSLPILVPCHRVVRSGGREVGNYSGGEGTVTKEWLLKHEGEMVRTTSGGTS